MQAEFDSETDHAADQAPKGSLVPLVFSSGTKKDME